MPTDRDPVEVAPEVYSVLFENDRVRVLEIRLRPGGKSPTHSHPAYAIYALAAGKVRFTLPDGTSKELELEAGQAGWSEAETHEVDNLGDTEVRALNIELK